MKIVKPSFKILTPIDRNDILTKLEKIGRICYKSEDKITENSASNFVKMLVDRGHEAMIEHYTISVRIICDRGISHEIVRHRIASYAQESTRYCNYSNDKFQNELTFIKPCFWKDKDTHQYSVWEDAMKSSEDEYLDLIKNGATPQEARSILPNSLKTEIVATMNLREWKHFFKMRCPKTAHPQMREITLPLYQEFRSKLPEIYQENYEIELLKEDK